MPAKSIHAEEPGLTGGDVAQGQIWKYIVYVKKHRVLCCREHKTGIHSLNEHLQRKHRVPAKEREEFIKSCTHLRIRRPHKVALPQPDGPPIEVLGEPLDGLQCQQPSCKYLTRNKNKMREHCKVAHKLPFKTGSEALYRQVAMQSFFPASGRQRYFTVQAPVQGRHAALPRTDRESVDELLQQFAATQEKRERQEQVMEAEVAKTDKTGWWKFTEWPEHFANRNCVHLAHAISPMPSGCLEETSQSCKRLRRR